MQNNKIHHDLSDITHLGGELPSSLARLLLAASMFVCLLLRSVPGDALRQTKGPAYLLSRRETGEAADTGNGRRGGNHGAPSEATRRVKSIGGPFTKIWVSGLQFALDGGPSPSILLWRCTEMELLTRRLAGRAWASRYALGNFGFKTYPKSFLRLAQAAGPARLTRFFLGRKPPPKTRGKPACANAAPGAKALRAPGRGGQGASNEPL